MSLIVELRAVWLYRLYQQILDEQKTGIALKSVLAEEELHLDAMLARLHDMDPDAPRHVEKFASLEDTGFRTLWRAIESDARAPERLAAE
jgi:ferritin-like protein